MSSRWGSCWLSRCDKLFPHSLRLSFCQCPDSECFTEIWRTIHAIIPLYSAQFGTDVTLSGKVRQEMHLVIEGLAEPWKKYKLKNIVTVKKELRRVKMTHRLHAGCPTQRRKSSCLTSYRLKTDIQPSQQSPAIL